VLLTYYNRFVPKEWDRAMKSYMIMTLVAAVSLLEMTSGSPVLAAAKTYSGSGEDAAHCSLWSSDRLRWPQTSVGREKQECRRRAVKPTSGVIQCRLRTSYIDQETGERMCIYQRGATGQGDMTTSMSKEFSCERSISCNQE
tara:strand:+ start:14 stop:439 length:426 start_codon:yes stop_codon:yes gene_type:complete